MGTVFHIWLDTELVELITAVHPEPVLIVESCAHLCVKHLDLYICGSSAAAAGIFEAQAQSVSPVFTGIIQVNMDYCCQFIKKD